MSFYKNTKLSKRTKQRRVQEEIKSSTTEYSTESVVVPSPVNSYYISNNEFNYNSGPSNNMSQLTQPIFNDINGSTDIIDTNEYDKSHYFSDDMSSSEIEGDESFDNYDNLSHFRFIIMHWAIDCNIPLIALNKLLILLKKHKCFETLPKDSRTIMCKNTIISPSEILTTVVPGIYHHFGILKGIEQNFTKCSVEDGYKIEIVVGIDGLPLFKS